MTGRGTRHFKPQRPRLPATGLHNCAML
jgi:hypothetical protein